MRDFRGLLNMIGYKTPASAGMMKKATFLTRLARNPMLRNIRLTDSRVADEILPYLKWFYKTKPDEATRLLKDPNASVGSFMDMFGKVVREYKAGKEGFRYHAPHLRKHEYNWVNSHIRGDRGRIPMSIAGGLPYSVKRNGFASVTDMNELFADMMRSPGSGITKPTYEELVRTFGPDNANRYVEAAVRRMDRGGLLKEMSRRGMTTREVYNSFSRNEPDFLEGNAGERLSKYFRRGLERDIAGPKYGVDYDALIKRMVSSDDIIPLRVSGKFNPATGFTRRQRRAISRQLVAEYRKLFGHDPTFQGKPIRMFVDSHPVTMDSLSSFNSSFNPIGGGTRSQKLDTLLNLVAPDISEKGFDFSIPSEVDRYRRFMARGPLRPEISTTAIMDRNGRFYFPRETFRHEAGHGMSMDANPGGITDFYRKNGNRFPALDWAEGYELGQNLSSTAGGVVPDWYKTVSKNPFSHDKTFMEELSANLRGGIGDSQGYTPALATYARYLAQTPEQHAFADGLARNFGIYKPNPFS